MRNLFILLMLLTGLAAADQVYIRNKPYKGPTSGAGAQTMVDLKALVTALDLKLEDALAKLALPPETEMVNLKETAEKLGARVSVNKALGTIDVNLPVTAIAAAPAAPTERREAPQQALPVQYAQQKSPGDAIDLKKELRFGKNTILYFYADW